MADLSINYIGLSLKNPLVISSSGMTMSVSGVKKCEKAGAGAVILKSVFEEQLIARENPNDERIYQDFLKEFYQNQLFIELEDYLKLIEATKNSVKIPVIASINCISYKVSWDEYINRIEKCGADGIEINIPIMPKSFKQTPYEIETHVFKIIYEISQQLKIPVIAKIGPFYTSIPKLVKGLHQNGAAAIALFNRFYQPDINLDKYEFVSKKKYSSPDDFSSAMRWISILYKEVNCDLIGATGIHNGISVIKAILSGASATEICSTLYIHGLEYVKTILKDIKDWMKENNVKSIKEIQGKLSQKNINYPEFFERYQYLRAMEGLE